MFFKPFYVTFNKLTSYSNRPVYDISQLFFDLHKYGRSADDSANREW